MPAVSASKAARTAAKAAKAAEKGEKPKTAASKLSSKANSRIASKAGSEASSVNGDDEDGRMIDADESATKDMDKVKALADQMDKFGLSDRVTTGVLASMPASKDVKITSTSLVFHGKVLITDSTLEVNFGRRYGLLGENGCGKSTLLKAIDRREYPFPDHVDIYLLNEGAPPSDFGALEWVVKEAQKEVQRLDDLAEKILEEEGPEAPELMDIYDRSEAMDPSTFETRASLILTGLGFNKKTIHKKTKDMSGGWRMRVALAKALFVKPSILLLDDPTAHLDLEACVWLEEYLKKWDKTLILVSHSMDFLNGVCTNMIDMRMKQLIYYGGNYDSYMKSINRKHMSNNKMKFNISRSSLLLLVLMPIWSNKQSPDKRFWIRWRQTVSFNLSKKIVSSPFNSQMSRNCHLQFCPLTMSHSVIPERQQIHFTRTLISVLTWTVELLLLDLMVLESLHFSDS